MSTLEIRDLVIEVGGKKILRGVDLTVKSGEIHVLMGPNGSGKSTLAHSLMGHPEYAISGGEMFWDGNNINRLSPDERSRLGLFIAFQYPVEIEGVSLEKFLRLSYNTLHPDNYLSVYDFREQLQEQLVALQMDEGFLQRNLNEDFSGGEKKKAEILQLAVLKPKIAVLDETDSGLDVDSLRVVARGVQNIFKSRQGDLGVLLITHYSRILRYIKPDCVHVMVGGKIMESGGEELANRLEKEGYGKLRS